SASLIRGVTDPVADTDATLAVEQDPLGQSTRLDAQVRAPADRVEITVRRAHAATVRDCRLAHGDAVLVGAVVVGVVPDPDLAGRLDQRGIQWIERFGVGDADRAYSAAEGVIASALIGFHALEERQNVLITPTAVAHLRPSIEILRLTAYERVPINRAG